MVRVFFSSILRTLGLIFFGDKVRFYLHYLNNIRNNKNFRLNNPHIQLPPDYLIYESFRMDYNKYFYGGLETCKFLISLLQKHIILKNISILDWGCGPGRITRHIPDLLDKSCKIYGTDYNKDSIRWCRENIKGAVFSENSLHPPMAFDDNTFDIILGISIFTHLSEKNHTDWFNELLRIAKRDGILIFSTQGKAFLDKLSIKEINKFSNGKLVVRGKTREGHRTFSAFHSPEYIKKLIIPNKILEFIEGGKSNRKPRQDIWIIKVIKR
jgi:ubiquinone/menaquinone biosynthesis C-methylase UbiE